MELWSLPVTADGQAVIMPICSSGWMPRLREKARIIHYAGFAKPWSFHDIPFADLWEHYYKETPFADRPLKRTSYAMMKKLYEKRRLLHPDEENQ